MPWYGWVLIGVGLVAIGYLKLKVWGNMTKAREEKKNQIKKMKDEEWKKAHWNYIQCAFTISYLIVYVLLNVGHLRLQEQGLV